MSLLNRKGKQAKPEKSLEQLQREKIEAEMKEVEREQKLRTKAFNFENAKRLFKRRFTFFMIIIIILIPVILFVLLSEASHQGPFSYTFSAYYSSIFSPITSFIGPLFSSFTSQLSCLSNPVACVVSPTQNITEVVYPTFESFLSFSSPGGTQTVYLTGNNTQAQLFYTIKNDANVPLGTATSNALILNESCGSTNNPSAAHICTVTTSPHVILPQTPFIGSIFAGASSSNETNVAVSCPSKNSGITLPTIASIILNFTVRNYSAATLLPVQFVSSDFEQQLLESAQPLKPSEPSVSFVSPGPIQVRMSAVQPMPIVTGSGEVPILISLKDNGNSTNRYNINSLFVFVPKSLWPSAPNSTGWNCASATSSIKMQFALPGSSYWVCTSTDNNQQLQSAGAQILLPQVTSLSTMHFDTVPILAYINYDYYEYHNMPYYISASGSVCG